MFRTAAILSLIVSHAAVADGDVGRPLAVVVDDYVREALRANLALKGQGFDIERQLAALAEARSRFLPQVNVEARYTRADGGREIELPPDQSFQFLRDREQDTRVTLRQPLYAPAIPAAFRAQRAVLDSAEFARQALARRLERDVTVGYLDWLRARSSVGIVESSLALLQENLRVTDSLHRNGRVTRDQVLRARAELLAVQQQRREVQNLESRGSQFVNFLLDRDLDAPLEVATLAWDAPTATVDDPPDARLRKTALERRPELRELASLERAADEEVAAQRSARQPQIALGLDGGIQGEDYDFGSGYNFGTASVLFSIPVFDGGAIRARVDAARASARQLATRREETARQIELEVQQALDQLRTAMDSLATAEARAEAAQAGFRISSSKRDEGVINQVDFLDARSALTSAELNLNLTRFELLSRQAELAYATAVNPLPLDEVSP